MDEGTQGGGGPARSGKLRELIQNLALGLCSTTIVFGGAEAVCRWTERARPSHPTAEVLDWQGWDGEFYTVKSTAVGHPPWEDYNQDGLRDREHSLEKPPGLRRVVMLGDSTTFGFWLPPEEAFPQVLQDLLDAHGRRTEVFNVALPGWTTRQELIAYRRIARKYHPDHVLLAVCLNDIPEMQNNLTRPPAFVMALFRRSALVRRVVLARDREIQDEMEMLQRFDSPKVRQGFELMFADLRRLREEARGDGASLGLLILPFRFQLGAGAPPPHVQRKILDFCRAEGLRCLDLLPSLGALGDAAFVDFDHLSAPGSRLVAEEILRSGLLPEEPPTASGSFPRSVPELAALLRVGEESRRAAAAWALGERGEAALPALPELIAALGAPSADERAAAAWAVGRLGTRARAAVAALTRLLDDTDDAVRWRAMAALRQVHPEAEEVLRTLRRLLEEPGGRGRALAADVVGRLGPAALPAVPSLVSALGDPRAEVRWRAAWALGQIGPAAHDAVPALTAALEDPEICWRVADALGGVGLGAGAAVPALARHLADASSSVRWRAARALSRIGPAGRAAAPQLLAHADDPEANVRLSVLVAIEAVGTDVARAIAAYRRGLHDEDWRVRTQAVNALGRLGPAALPAVEEIRALLHDGDAGVRAKAARALGRSGSAEPDMLADLRVAAQDPDERVREAALKALRLLR